MSKKYRLLVYIIVSGFLFATDQLLKSLARANPDFTYYLWKPWLGWEYFANSGIAFSLPFPNWLIVILTPIILLGLIILCAVSLRGGVRATTKQSSSPEIASSPRICGVPRNDIYLLSLILIIAGAISNCLDRIFFGATTDYLRILTGVINLADVMITAGVTILFLKIKSKN